MKQDRHEAQNLRVALVHDWLTGMRGGEKVLEVLCELFPDATLFTLLHNKGAVSPTIEGMDIRTSFIQRLPFKEEQYRNYLPLMPRAIESFDFSSFDLIVSISHCVAKGSIPRGNAIHLCCCLTPMRYIWDQYPLYFGPGASMASRAAMRVVRPYLQRWDVESSKRVHEFIAISGFVAERIKQYYNRESSVIYPPVDAEFYSPAKYNRIPRESYYLIISALAPYKRVELAIKVFNQSGKKLKIIGSGQSEKELKAQSGPNIEFLGWQSNESIRDHYRGCRALLFPGVEDFGIVPLEAMACGKPVIAYAKGGALETVVVTGGDRTGILFHEQTAEALQHAIQTLEKTRFHPKTIRKHAETFSRDRFKKKLLAYVQEKVEGRIHI